jgi:hypothetical protein
MGAIAISAVIRVAVIAIAVGVAVTAAVAVVRIAAAIGSGVAGLGLIPTTVKAIVAALATEIFRTLMTSLHLMSAVPVMGDRRPSGIDGQREMSSGF